MVLSDKRILAALGVGDIVIDPFDPRNLGTDTYDVRLGEFFYKEQSINPVANVFSPVSVREVWGSPRKAIRLDAPCVQGWSPDNQVILLQPGETILAHTIEFIGARRNYTTRMHARSSAGRSMLGVCKCAGRGDCGFFNRWTMEITSFARHHVIPLKVGMRIAQIEFVQVGDTDQRYGVDRGKYQESDDLEQLKASWKPEMMLPRFHEDWELKGG